VHATMERSCVETSIVGTGGVCSSYFTIPPTDVLGTDALVYAIVSCCFSIFQELIPEMMLSHPILRIRVLNKNSLSGEPFLILLLYLLFNTIKDIARYFGGVREHVPIFLILDCI